MVVKMLLNKFDCFIIIEGNRGLGKSTLAWQIAKRVHLYFRDIEKETGGKESPFYRWHEFKPKKQLIRKREKYLLYKREDVLNFFDGWHKTAIPDEMINVAFNREFWNNDQKNLIKLINMNRDHGNLLIACVPQFQTLDNQIKNLCKIRITIPRRSLAVIQTPNRSIYNKDKWDTANNEKIEREWFKKGTGLPQYPKLNTFRGMMHFKALTKPEQEIYDKIKVAERNVIKKDLGVTGNTDDKKEDVFGQLYKRLIEGAVRNSFELSGYAYAMNMTPETLRRKISKRLFDDKLPTLLANYYWDKRTKNILAEDKIVQIK